jgi:hypothetical protein
LSLVLVTADPDADVAVAAVVLIVVVIANRLVEISFRGAIGGRKDRGGRRVLSVSVFRLSFDWHGCQQGVHEIRSVDVTAAAKRVPVLFGVSVSVVEPGGGPCKVVSTGVFGIKSSDEWQVLVGLLSLFSSPSSRLLVATARTVEVVAFWSELLNRPDVVHVEESSTTGGVSGWCNEDSSSPLGGSGGDMLGSSVGVMGGGGVS